MTWKPLNLEANNRKVPGVYAIYRHGKLIYVGQSVDVRARVRAHFNSSNLKLMKDLKGITVKYKVCPNHVALEDKLIRRLRPRGNQRPINRTPSKLQLKLGLAAADYIKLF